MTGFKLKTSGYENNCFANWATDTLEWRVTKVDAGESTKAGRTTAMPLQMGTAGVMVPLRIPLAP